MAKHGSAKKQLTEEEQALEVEAEKVSEELKAEIDKWVEAQIDPSKVQFNIFQLDTRVHALIDFLVEEKVIDDRKFTLALKKRTLANLIEARKTVLPFVRDVRAKVIGEEASTAAAQLPKILDRHGNQL